jgi:serine protease Do
MSALGVEPLPFADSLNLDLAEVAKDAREALIRVVSRGYGVGSGVIWDSSGVIVTNAHVVEDEGVSVVTSAGDEMDARVVHRDAQADIAVLKVDAAGLSAAPVGDPESLRAGEMVFALGYPWGISAAVTAGVVIGVGDQEEVYVGTKGRPWLTVNMRLRPGNSGGPVIDSRGRVVGISTVMAGSQIGLAVSSSVVSEVVQSAFRSGI